MPKINYRQVAINLTEHSVLLDLLDDILTDKRPAFITDGNNSDSSEDDTCPGDDDYLNDLTSPIMVRLYLQYNRYVSRLIVPKCDAFCEILLFNLDESRFRQEMRLSRTTFELILCRISDHKIFQNNSRHEQASVQKQLATVMWRFGSVGNAVSEGSVARKFGISEGTVRTFTNRILVALLSLEKTTVRWPTTEEKKQTKREIKAKHHFPSCLGFVDGTDIVLAFKPAANGEDYYSRKKSYSLSAMIVCDNNKKILYTNCGFTGSAHDSRVSKNTALWRNPERFFQNDEYLLGDSAYAISTTVIPPYRKSEKRNNPGNRRLNKAHSRARVRVEHCIGMTKNRFQCLKGLRILIKCKEDHARAVFWFRACTVLHNLCIESNDPYDITWGQLPEHASAERGNAAADTSNSTEAGREKRERIKFAVLTSLAE